MKKLKFWLAGLSFVALIIALAININLKYGVTSDINEFSLTNVEALAQGEGGLESECFGSGTLVCGSGQYKTRVSR